MTMPAPASDFSTRGDPDRLPSALEVRIQFAPTLPLVRLTGELDLDSLHRLTDALDAIAATDCPADLVVLDLAGVTFCDVAGLRSLEQCALALEVSGRQLMLYEPPRIVTRLMAMTGIAQWLPVRN
jgi:anti-sigma B factor antagonist